MILSVKQIFDCLAGYSPAKVSGCRMYLYETEM